MRTRAVCVFPFVERFEPLEHRVVRTTRPPTLSVPVDLETRLDFGSSRLPAVRSLCPHGQKVAQDATVARYIVSPGRGPDAEKLAEHASKQLVSPLSSAD